MTRRDPAQVLELLDQAVASPGDRDLWMQLVAATTEVLEEDRLEALLERDAANHSAAWAIVLSLVEPDDLDKLVFVRRHALVFAERAMSGHAGPQMAVRTARLREELGVDSVDAWAEAARVDPLIAWAFPKETAGAAGAIDIDIMRALSSSSSRDEARNRLIRVVAGRTAPDAALIAAAMEDIADLCVAMNDAGLARVRGYQARLVDRTAACVLDGLLVALDLPSEASPLAEFFEEPGLVVPVMHALRAMMRSGAVDVRALLREAWLEAMIDPVVAFAEPRSALSKLRTAFVALSLVATIGGVASTVQAQEPSAGGAATEPRDDEHPEQRRDESENAAPTNPWSRQPTSPSPWSR